VGGVQALEGAHFLYLVSEGYLTAAVEVDSDIGPTREGAASGAGSNSVYLWRTAYCAGCDGLGEATLVRALATLGFLRDGGLNFVVCRVELLVGADRWRGWRGLGR